MGERKRTELAPIGKIIPKVFRELETISEADILRSVCLYLDWLKTQKKLTYRRITTTGIPAKGANGETVFRKNSASGMADILVFAYTQGQPKTLHFELKRPGGKLSESQEKWRNELAAVGHSDYFVIHSADQVLKLMERMGIDSRGENGSR